MTTFKRHLKQSLTALIFIASFLAYSPVFAETTDADSHSSHHTQTTQTNLWSGVYHGFLPCDDCKGIKTTLALNKNNTYLLITQYVGKSEREIVEKGKLAWGENDTIILTPRNSTETRQYFISDNQLIQLDSKGNRIINDNTDRYILRRNEMKETKSSSSHH
jgi:uncharacterized lipoprotein NlpE involved in copper resistance